MYFQKFPKKIIMVLESKKILIASAILNVILVISLSSLAVHYNGKYYEFNKKISEQNKTISEYKKTTSGQMEKLINIG